VQNAECGVGEEMRNAECVMRNAECGVQNGECGVRSHSKVDQDFHAAAGFD